jgi:hypothetical protein
MAIHEPFLGKAAEQYGLKASSLDVYNCTFQDNASHLKPGFDYDQEYWRSSVVVCHSPHTHTHTHTLSLSLSLSLSSVS